MLRGAKKMGRGGRVTGSHDTSEGKRKQRRISEAESPAAEEEECSGLGEAAAAPVEAGSANAVATPVEKEKATQGCEDDHEEDGEEDGEDEEEGEEEGGNEAASTTTNLVDQPVSMEEALGCTTTMGAMAAPPAPPASPASQSAGATVATVAAELTPAERLRNLQATLEATQRAQDVTTRNAVVARQGERGLFIEGVVIDPSKRITLSDGKPSNTLTIAVDRCTVKGGEFADSLLVADAPSPIAYVWPTTFLQPTPEQVATNPNAKGKPAMEMFQGADTPCMAMQALSLNFFDEHKKFDPTDCPPGSRVSVSCCKVVMRRNKETQVPQLFLNGVSVMPIASAPPGTASPLIREFAMMPEQQYRSALALAAAAGGWAHITANKGAPDAAKAQAKAAVACAAKHQEAVLATLEKKIESLTSGELVATTADAGKLAGEFRTIHRRASRKSADDLCAGVQTLLAYKPGEKSVGSDHAWLVQEGRFPSDAQRGLTHPVLQAAIDAATGDDAALAAQPDAGCVAWISHVGRDGNFLRVSFQFQAYYNKDQLISDAMDRGQTGLLGTLGDPSICVQLGMKDCSLRLTGSRVAAKAVTAFTEVLPYSNMALQVEVAPRRHNDAALSPAWARGVSSIEFSDGILKAGIPVTKKFLIAQWLEGKDAYIHKEVKEGDGVATVDTPPSVTGPDLAVAGCNYQALSEGSFEFQELAPPDKDGIADGRTIVFRVVVDGCANAIKALRRQGKIGAEVQAETAERRLPDAAYAAGEEMLLNMCGEEESIKTMIKARGVVYAVRLA